MNSYSGGFNMAHSARATKSKTTPTVLAGAALGVLITPFAAIAAGLLSDAQ